MWRLAAAEKGGRGAAQSRIAGCRIRASSRNTTRPDWPMHGRSDCSIIVLAACKTLAHKKWSQDVVLAATRIQSDAIDAKKYNKHNSLHGKDPELHRVSERREPAGVARPAGHDVETQQIEERVPLFPMSKGPARVVIKSVRRVVLRVDDVL